MTIPQRKPRLTMFFYLAVGCFTASALLLLGYFGACAALLPVAEGSRGEVGEVGALIFAVVFFIAGLAFWGRRKEPAA